MDVEVILKIYSAKLITQFLLDLTVGVTFTDVALSSI